MESTQTDSYRDHLYNTDEGGRRVGFYPKKPKGRLYNLRTIFSLFLLGLFFGTPWIEVNDHPFMLFNILERKFIIFGQVFWPQDFFLFVLVFISFFLFVILFTVVFGRLWCGWACPQTIFLEMVYRKVEHLIEGDAPAQRRLAKAPWNFEKIWKKTLTQSVFIGIAFLVSNTVLAYIVGMDKVLSFVTHSPFSQPVFFGAVIFNTAVFYFVFAWFREQACIFVCPYGRMQSVLLDNNTVVISYDFKRGEPRGKLSKTPDPSKGDCIDCRQCIAVCPTGIDIRNGTQLECVNCTACIDACDEIMDKVNKPKGLIRFASHNQVEQRIPFRLTGRAKAYSVVLTILLTAVVVITFIRGDLKTTVLRAPGKLFTTTQEGKISNLYTVKILNKTEKERILTIQLEDMDGRLALAGRPSIKVPAGREADGAFTIELSKEKLTGRSTPLSIGVYEDGKRIQTVQTSFTGPIK